MIDNRLHRTCCFTDEVHLAVPTATTTGRDLLTSSMAGKHRNQTTEQRKTEVQNYNGQNTPEQCFQMGIALLLFK